MNINTLKDLLQLALNPATAYALFIGLIVGYGIGAWYTRKTIHDLRGDTDRLREELTKKSTELEKQSREKANCEAEIQDIRGKIKTITCPICGGKLSKESEYEKHRSSGGPLKMVAMKCAPCGQVFDFTLEIIKHFAYTAALGK